MKIRYSRTAENRRTVAYNITLTRRSEDRLARHSLLYNVSTMSPLGLASQGIDLIRSEQTIIADTVDVDENLVDKALYLS